MTTDCVKSALVTGATRSMGVAIARRLARDGFAVMGCGRSLEIGSAAAKEIVTNGGRADFVECDLLVPAQISAAVDATINAFGRIDVVVNNAAAVEHVRGGRDLPLADIDPTVFLDMFKVGVLGPLHLAKAVLPHMLEQGTGAFVHISSVAAVRAIRGLTAYGPSKAALESLSTQIAMDYGSSGIRSNCVRVGTIRVDANIDRMDHPKVGPLLRRQQMLERSGLPDDVAAAVSYLASADASFVTGAILSVDGGSGSKQVNPMPAEMYAAAAADTA